TGGTVSGGNGLFTVSGTHTYADVGQFTVTTTLSEDGGSEAAATVPVTINVANSAPVPGQPVTITAVEGIATGDQAVATFTDPGNDTNLSDFSADIDWGDGSTDTATITLDPSTGVFTVTGSHTYAEEGTDTITVTIHHQTASATATGTATVADAALTAQGTSLT